MAKLSKLFDREKALKVSKGAFFKSFKSVKENGTQKKKKNSLRINLVKRYFEGIIIGFGILTVLLSFFLLTYAGWHPASQIISGVFKGNYTFNGSVNFSKGLTARNISTQVIKIISVKNFSQIVNYNVSNGAALFYDNESIVNECDPFHDGSGVALYKLDGNAVDACGKYNGTWNGTENYTQGVFGEAASFGPNDFINFSSGLSDNVFKNSNIITFSYWILFYNYRNYGGRLISIQNYMEDQEGIGLFKNEIYSGGGVYYNNGAILPFNLSNNIWYYIVGVSDGKKGTKIYVNGNLVIESNKTMYNITEGENFYINYDPAYSKTPILIDQVRIFNRALTPEEVKELYNEELKGLFMKTPNGNIERIATVSNS